MSILFIDTETSDLPKDGDLIQPGQARVCQIAMLLTNHYGETINEFSTLIIPNGWSIQPGAAKAHGFTDEKCRQYGVTMKIALFYFMRMGQIATTIVAHNEEFDRRLLAIEAAYSNSVMPARPWFCTMKAAAPVVDLPPTEKMLRAGRNHPKPPQLEEALEFLTGRSLGDTAHDAMYDVKACRDIYFSLLDRNLGCGGGI